MGAPQESIPDRSPNLEAWLAAARRGDARALESILQSFRPELVRIAQRKMQFYVHGDADVTGLLQDTFVEAQLIFPRFAGETEYSTFAWLKRILLSNLVDSMRCLAVHKEALLNPRAERKPEYQFEFRTGPEQLAEARAIFRQLGEQLARLPEEQQVAIRLRDVDNLSFARIASAMGKPTPDSARKLYDLAVRALVMAMSADVQSSTVDFRPYRF